MTIEYKDDDMMCTGYAICIPQGGILVGGRGTKGELQIFGTMIEARAAYPTAVEESAVTDQTPRMYIIRPVRVNYIGEFNNG